jgi:sugar phosphate isomerase/epimerase
VVRWLEVFKLLNEKGFTGHLSYEAPNPELWKWSPVELCREAVELTRSLVKKALN